MFELAAVLFAVSLGALGAIAAIALFIRYAGPHDEPDDYGV